MKDDLQKSDSCGLKSERKKILASSTCSLACLSTNLGAFCPMVVHLLSENRFSHIFPVPGGLPFLTVILTVKLARLVLCEYCADRIVLCSNTNALLLRWHCWPESSSPLCVFYPWSTPGYLWMMDRIPGGTSYYHISNIRMLKTRVLVPKSARVS